VIARLCALALLVLCACPLSLLRSANAGPTTEVPAGVDPAHLTAPLGKGLPVMVRTAVYFADIEEIDENEGEFAATVDVRLRWEDPRLRYPASDAPRGFVDLRDEAAEARIAQIWTPHVALANVVDEPADESRGLRVYPDGRVELMQRMRARFKTLFDFERFPFDRQQLRVELVSRRETSEVVVLDYRQDDLDFTRVAADVRLPGWSTGLADFRRAPLTGWHGESHARVWVGLEVVRRTSNSVQVIFIPLCASLFIPLLAMWLNRIEDGEFKVAAFELANMAIGGLFAVIALNFTVGAEYPALAAADNTVARLFALNYVVLAASLVVNLVLFRFNVVRRLFGKYVQEQLYIYLMWALPLLSVGTATAIVLVAMA
jgi:Neurotransmitter-gated ion-channel ligand binding domain